MSAQKSTWSRTQTIELCKATLVYDDLAQAMKEETLGYALFASYNYSPALYEGFVE